MFPDRIEFQNPGALYNTLTIENLYAGCQPVRRNQLLAGFMRDYKSALTGRSYMEARGEGIPEPGQGQPASVRAPPQARTDRGRDQADDLRRAP
jgi:predicted HTH transcriptional regulator